MEDCKSDTTPRLQNIPENGNGYKSLYLIVSDLQSEPIKTYLTTISLYYRQLFFIEMFQNFA